MGLLTGPRKEDIESLLKAKDIDALGTYVVARRHNSALMGTLKLLLSNLFYAMDAAVIRIIAATESDMVVINPNWQIGAQKLENLDDKHIQRIPWTELESVQVTGGRRVGKISWRYQGKTSTWVVDLGNPGVWHFNPTHFTNLEKVIAQRSEQ